MKIFKLELKSNYRSFLIWTVCCSALLLIYIAVYPMMKGIDYEAMLSQMTQSMPSALTKMFGMDVVKDYSKLSSYLTIVLTEFNVALMIYGAYLGSVTLVKEESEGTIEYLYSMPVSRTKIFIEKLLAVITIYFGFVAINMIVGIIGSFFVTQVDSDLLFVFFKIFSGCFIAGLVYLAFGYFLSTVFRTTKQALAGAIGIVFITFVLNSISGISDEVEWLKYMCPIKYCDATMLVNTWMETPYIVLSICIIAVSILIGFLIYKTKDFKV